VGATGYRELIAFPKVRWQAVTGLAAQVIQGAASAGVILVVREHGYSLALGGGVAAAFWISGGIARPLQGRIIDRRGSATLTAVSGIVNCAAFAGVVGLAAAHAPGVVLVALGAAGGLSLAPVSTSMRIAWAAAGSGPDRTAAYSLVYLIQEVAILTGPLVLAVLLAVGSPSLALLAVVAIATAGTLAFASSIRSLDRTPAAAHKARVLTIRQLPSMVLVAMLAGGVIGGIQVGAPAVATAHHTPYAAGLLLAAVSVGGIIGAALYTVAGWRADPATRLLVLVASLTVAVALGTLVHGLVLLGAVLLLVGLPLNPVFSTLSVLVDRHVPARAAGEAFGYLSTGMASGTGIASALAAALAQDRHDGRVAFIVCAVAGVLATALVAAASRSLRAPTR
jgi:MFS family permease